MKKAIGSSEFTVEDLLTRTVVQPRASAGRPIPNQPERASVRFLRDTFRVAETVGERPAANRVKRLPQNGIMVVSRSQ
jgi:hypothetical protein